MGFRQLVLNTAEVSSGPWGICNYDKVRVASMQRVQDDFWECVVEIGHTNCGNYDNIPWCVNRRVVAHFRGPKADPFKSGDYTPRALEDYVLDSLSKAGEIGPGTPQNVC
jgi:hypothetical protein